MRKIAYGFIKPFGIMQRNLLPIRKLRRHSFDNMFVLVLNKSFMVVCASTHRDKLIIFSLNISFISLLQETYFLLS